MLQTDGPIHLAVYPLTTGERESRDWLDMGYWVQSEQEEE